jgi:SAM-dependent methyltransferase
MEQAGLAKLRGWRERAHARRAQRALVRQLAYQQSKSEQLRGREALFIDHFTQRTSALRERLAAIVPIGEESRILEVGSGAHGHIFFFGAKEAIGVDPLADHYREQFPAWQRRARTLAVGGEALPFADSSFEIVISDNVVDHAVDPARIVREMVRVLVPGGLLYFTVNVHHPLYRAAAALYAGWKALRLPGEIGPFADHTVHFTPPHAARLFDGLPLRLVSEGTAIEAAKRKSRTTQLRHPGDLFKRIFYKNAVYERIAIRS